ncbi:DUF1793-domain-containing protein [Schizopora paradoxa]|uniref:DUF1793-domain-containing protein n=1 Tax=Schizopora paradoxa TaxID=27342 RepID=A0A0H2S3R4_9AGAM|nr:DUF1793-domain-containing protein [Schizopora paradoxa]
MEVICEIRQTRPSRIIFNTDLGEISDAPSEPLVFAIGALRNPSVEVFNSLGETSFRSPYYTSNPESESVNQLVSSFLQNFTSAVSQAEVFDNNLMDASLAISQEYADLISISLRAAVSSLEITIPQEDQGQWNSSEIQAYMKDMGGVGNGGVNAVDVLYASFPMYLYLDADLGGYLLTPLLEAQQDVAYNSKFSYAASNLGNHFPRARLQADAQNLGIEQSSNMIIMTLAHAQATGSISIASTYYSLLRQWTEYLVVHALSPDAQTTSQADGITYTNQTNLALKGICAIAAMARISSALQVTDDQSRYEKVSKEYISQWLTLSISEDSSHLLMSYGMQNSSGLVYNLFADKLLQLDLVPEYVYQMQTDFHAKQLGESTFGLPLDAGNPELGRIDWAMFTAAIFTDNGTRNNLIEQIHQYAGTLGSNVSMNAPLTTVYDPTTGNTTSGSNRYDMLSDLIECQL